MVSPQETYATNECRRRAGQPINTLAQVFADPQVIARGLVREVARPVGVSSG